MGHCRDDCAARRLRGPRRICVEPGVRRSRGLPRLAVVATQLLVSGGQLGVASDLMFLRLVFPLTVFAAILAFIAASYRSEWLLTISACVLAQKYIEGFFDLSYAYMQKSNNWKSLAISTVVRCSLLAVVFAGVYVLTNRLVVALIAVTGFSVLFYL